MSTPTAPIPLHPTDGPIHGWFELSYSSYAVQPRTLLQSMPIEWQERFVACLEEFHDAFGHVEQAEAYQVLAGTEHVVSEMDDFQLAWAGVAVDRYNGEEPPEGLGEEALAAWQEEHEAEPTYHHIRDGREMDPGERVILPCDDPVPHYRHAYIEPAAEYLAARSAAVAAHAAAVRSAAFTEAANAVVAFTDNPLDANAKMLRRLAATPTPTTPET